MHTQNIFKQKHKTKNMLSEIISDLGAFGGLPAFITAIIITYGLEQALALKLIVALAIAYIVTFTIRIAYFKQRPKQQKYNTILQKIDASSFPSLHSMRATILAILLSQCLGNILIS